MHAMQIMLRDQKSGVPVGIYSACSANEYVLKAVLKKAAELETTALIEATANQVNQFGGYTGMTPKTFYDYVMRLAKEAGIDESQVILGGDHLGPLTWTNLPEAEAMANADELIRAFVLAGFTKIHIDTSMRVADDDPKARLADEVIARRGARLAKVAEEAFAERKAAFPDAQAPVYVVGSEVPIPGGAQKAESAISVTRREDCLNTVKAFRDAYAALGLKEAWGRVIALVVQPGVEFGDDEVFAYDHGAAASLLTALKEIPLVFEGHSTDYQTRECLRAMVRDGIAILKVGPALTFAYREALLALSHIEDALVSDGERSRLFEVLEKVMLESPGNWAKHYHGSEKELRVKRVFSYSDRARYYLPNPEVDAAIRRLLENLSRTVIPDTLISQYLPLQYRRVRAGELEKTPEALILDRIGDLIDDYLYATGV